MEDRTVMKFHRATALLARIIAFLLFRGPVTVTSGRTRFIFDPRRGRIIPTIAGGAGDDDPPKDDPPKDDPPKDDPPAEDPPKDDPPAEDPPKEDDPDDPPKDDAADQTVDYWKSQARKHEGRSKRDREAREAAEAKLREREDANKSEQEKALDKAREEARREALTESSKERRADRLENAVIRQAAKGVNVKTGDDEKVLKFSDPEDALVFIERAIAKGDIDEDDIFDADGKVKADGIADELAQLARRKPNLIAGASGDDPPPDNGAKGGADGGKGGGASKDLDEMSPDEHLKEIQGRA